MNATKTGILGCLMIVLLQSSTVWAQETDHSFKFHGASFSMGMAAYDGDLGFASSLDAGVAWGPHILKVLLLATEDSFGIFSDSGTQQYDLLYGREFSLGGISWLDAFAGLGYMEFDEFDSNTLKTSKENSLAFPVMGRLRFQTDRTIGFGVQAHASFQQGPALFTAGGFLQLKF